MGLTSLAMVTQVLAADPSDVRLIRDYIIRHGQVEVVDGGSVHTLVLGGSQINYPVPNSEIKLLTATGDGVKDKLFFHVREGTGVQLRKGYIADNGVTICQDGGAEDFNLDGVVDSCMEGREIIGIRDDGKFIVDTRQYPVDMKSEVPRKRVQTLYDRVIAGVKKIIDGKK